MYPTPRCTPRVSTSVVTSQTITSGISMLGTKSKAGAYVVAMGQKFPNRNSFGFAPHPLVNDSTR